MILATVKLEVCWSNFDRATFKMYLSWVVLFTTVGSQGDPKKIDIKFIPKSIYQVVYVFSIDFTLKNSCKKKYILLQNIE